MKNMDSRITEPILVHASRKPKNAPSTVTKRVYGTLAKDRNVLDAQQNHTIRTDVTKKTIGSFRFEDEDEDEDEDEALCFRHNDIFKLFRLQLGRDDEVDCNNVVTPSLSRIWACAQWAKVGLGPRSRRRLQI